MGRAIETNSRQIGWTASQRRALIALLFILLVALGVRLALNRHYVSDPHPPQGTRYEELATRIDPNTADWQTLAAIPTLGEKRAKQIVEYRQRMQAGDPNAIVFHAAADLLRIRGIGRATIDNLQSYLIFPPANVTYAHPAVRMRR